MHIIQSIETFLLKMPKYFIAEKNASNRFVIHIMTPKNFEPHSNTWYASGKKPIKTYPAVRLSGPLLITTQSTIKICCKSSHAHQLQSSEL